MAQTAIWSVPPTYDSLEEYGSLYKIRKDGKVGLADIAGKVLIEARYDSITPFYEHLSLALEYEGGKYLLKGIIDDYNYGIVVPSGRYYINMKYPMFYNGKLVVADNTDKYGYLLPDGSLFIPCQYDAAAPFYEGLAYVKKGEKVEYLKSNGEELETALEKKGYIFLTGTHFNERGEAFVQAKLKGSGMGYSIIDTNGIEIRKAKLNGKKLKNYEYRKPFQFPSESRTELTLNPIKLIEENEVYGYSSENGSVLLPPQFSDASLFQEGYAKVKKDGKFGILRLQSGSFLGKLDKSIIEARNGRCKSIYYTFTYPSTFNGIPMELYVSCNNYEKEKVSFNHLGNCKASYSFVPNVQDNEKEKVYHYSLYADNLLLWEDEQRITINYVKSYPPFLQTPQITGDYTVDEDGFVRADSDNKVDVYTVIENRSSEILRITVTLGGNGVMEVSEEFSIAPESNKRISTSIYQIKERNSIEVYARTSTGLEQKVVIKVKPFV